MPSPTGTSTRNPDRGPSFGPIPTRPDPSGRATGCPGSAEVPAIEQRAARPGSTSEAHGTSREGKVIMSSGSPQQQGLYDPRHEHDACGVGFVVDLKGRKSHTLVHHGLT